MDQEIFLRRLGQGELVQVEADWFDYYFQLGFLKDYITQKYMEEIIIHNPQTIELVDSKGHRQETSKLDHNLWNSVASYLCLKHGFSFNLNQPFASFTFALYGMTIRASFIHQAALSTLSHKAFFRILGMHIFDLTEFSAQDTQFLQDQVDQKNNIIISGPTGSGKTSLLKTFFHYSVLTKKHTITIEDTHELQHSYPWVTSMVAKDHLKYSMEHYLSCAMRMRPDRIILGEIRSSEVVPLLLALNCGHCGVLSTIHANSAPDALYRLITLFQIYNTTPLSHDVVMSLLCHNIHTVIHMEQKKITQMIKVLGHDEGRLIYKSLLNS